jgi:hypothetical protein
VSKNRKSKHRPQPSKTDFMLSVVWDGPSLLGRIAQLGPGICTVSYSTKRMLTPMVFDVQKDGRFGAEPETQDLILKARFYRLIGEHGTLGVIVRTFLLHRMVDIPRGNDPSKTIHVPVKELRGYVVESRRQEKQIVLRYMPIPIDELRLGYSVDAQTGKPIEMPLPLTISSPKICYKLLGRA